MKIRGFITLPLILGAGVVLAVSVGLGIQSWRLDREQSAHADTRAQLKAFKAETERVAREAEERVKRAFEKQERVTGEVKQSYEKRIADLNARYRRLRDERARAGGSPVPAVPETTRPADDAARDSRLLEVLRYAEEQTIRLIELQQWVRQLQE